MKRVKHSLVLLTIGLLGSVTIANADVSVSFSTHHRSHRDPHYSHHRHGHGHHRGHYSPWRHPAYHPRYRSHRVVTVTPIVVQQPYYVQPTPTIALSGNYGQDLASFREKHSRLRTLIHRQKEKGGLTEAAYDRFMIALHNLERDQRARAFDRGGNLTPGDFEEFFRRLDQTEEEIQIALAE